MEERFSGLVLPLLRGSLPDFGPVFERYADDLKQSGTTQSFARCWRRAHERRAKMKMFNAGATAPLGNILDRCSAISFREGHNVTTTFSIAVDIQASSDRVWAVLCDVERWPEWTSSMTTVRRMDDGPLILGSRAQVRNESCYQRFGKLLNSKRKEGSHGSPLAPVSELKGDHWIEANGARSTVKLSLQFSGLLAPLVARIYRSLSQRYLATEAEGLRKRCEG